MEDMPARLPTQAQVLAWRRKRWPHLVAPEWCGVKLAEEAGEVNGAITKTAEGEGRKDDADTAQETAQTVIVAMALAESVGFDLWGEVAKEYARIGDEPAMGLLLDS